MKLYHIYIRNHPIYNVNNIANSLGDSIRISKMEYCLVPI